MPNTKLHPSAWALDTIKISEGLRLKSYQDTGGVLTIGYGHTGSDVHADTEISKEQAEHLLEQDLEEAAEQIRLLIISRISVGQFDALCDFVFNLGIGALKSSTLLRKLNQGDVKGAAEEFLKWDKAHVKEVLVALPGLTKRRAKEKERFLS